MEPLRLAMDGFERTATFAESFREELLGGDTDGEGRGRWYSSAKTCLVHETINVRPISGSPFLAK